MCEKLKNVLQETLHTAVKNGELAGGNLMVIQDGKELVYLEEGLADIEQNKPISRNAIFRLYSMSKPVTAASVMILMERGILDLFEPVSNYLPGFAGQMVDVEGELVAAEREVNIHDLLSMTSGLVYEGYPGKASEDTALLYREIGERLLSDNPMSTVEIADRLGKCALAFQPGTSWHYGTSADVLGAVVEKVSGIRFGEFLEKEIFEPLGMHDTGFYVTPDKQERLVKTYAQGEKGKLTYYEGNHLGINNQMDHIPAYESGGAGLVSTIDDYARFGRMLINHGTLDGIQIMLPRTVEYMTSCNLNTMQQTVFHNKWTHLAGYNYGNLMRVMTECGKAGLICSPGEYGWDGWLGGYFTNCPAEKLTILFLMQKTDTGTTSLTRKLRNIILSTLM